MSYLGNFDNLDDEKNDNVVVTNYEDFRKIVCAFIKRMRPKDTTDSDVEKLIVEGGRGLVLGKSAALLWLFNKGLVDESTLTQA